MKINYNYIVSYAVHKKKYVGVIWWQDYEKGSLFTPATREGFYNLGDFLQPVYLGTTFTKDNMYIEGKEVFYKPHVEIYLTTKEKHTKFFETEEEMDIWVQNNLQQIKTLEI